jgi:hypothetical protein
VGPSEAALDSPVLEAGDCVHLEPGVRHPVTALVDLLLLEASTTELSDVIRIEIATAAKWRAERPNGATSVDQARRCAPHGKTAGHRGLQRLESECGKQKAEQPDGVRLQPARETLMVRGVDQPDVAPAAVVSRGNTVGSAVADASAACVVPSRTTNT